MSFVCVMGIEFHLCDDNIKFRLRDGEEFRLCVGLSRGLGWFLLFWILWFN